MYRSLSQSGMGDRWGTVQRDRSVGNLSHGNGAPYSQSGRRQTQSAAAEHAMSTTTPARLGHRPSYTGYAGMTQAPPNDTPILKTFQTCGVAQMQNKRVPKNVKQQDGYFVHEDLGGDFGGISFGCGPCALYGMIDGHGRWGELATEYVIKTLPGMIAHSPAMAQGDIRSALTDCFLEVDSSAHNLGPQSLPLDMAGCCLTVVIITLKSIWVAWVGDCSTSIASSLPAKSGRGAVRIDRITMEHDIENVHERHRVASAGGIVSVQDKRWTLPDAPGRIQVTRAIGDWWAKGNSSMFPQTRSRKGVMLSVPEVAEVSRSGQQMWILLGSDGIFHFMRDTPDLLQDIWPLVEPYSSDLEQSLPLAKVAKDVVVAAIDRHGSDDNCTFMLINLHRLYSDTEYKNRQKPSEVPPQATYHPKRQVSNTSAPGEGPPERTGMDVTPKKEKEKEREREKVGGGREEEVVMMASYGANRPRSRSSLGIGGRSNSWLSSGGTKKTEDPRRINTAPNKETQPNPTPSPSNQPSGQSTPAGRVPQVHSNSAGTVSRSTFGEAMRSSHMRSSEEKSEREASQGRNGWRWVSPESGSGPMKSSVPSGGGGGGTASLPGSRYSYVRQRSSYRPSIGHSNSGLSGSGSRQARTGFGNFTQSAMYSSENSRRSPSPSVNYLYQRFSSFGGRTPNSSMGFGRTGGR